MPRAFSDALRIRLSVFVHRFDQYDPRKEPKFTEKCDILRRKSTSDTLDLRPRVCFGSQAKSAFGTIRPYAIDSLFRVRSVLISPRSGNFSKFSKFSKFCAEGAENLGDISYCD